VRELSQRKGAGIGGEKAKTMWGVSTSNKGSGGNMFDHRRRQGGQKWEGLGYRRMARRAPIRIRNHALLGKRKAEIGGEARGPCRARGFASLRRLVQREGAENALQEMDGVGGTRGGEGEQKKRGIQGGGTIWRPETIYHRGGD